MELAVADLLQIGKSWKRLFFVLFFYPNLFTYVVPYLPILTFTIYFHAYWNSIQLHTTCCMYIYSISWVLSFARSNHLQKIVYCDRLPQTGNSITFSPEQFGGGTVSLRRSRHMKCEFENINCCYQLES